MVEREGWPGRPDKASPAESSLGSYRTSYNGGNGQLHSTECQTVGFAELLAQCLNSTEPGNCPNAVSRVPVPTVETDNVFVHLGFTSFRRSHKTRQDTAIAVISPITLSKKTCRSLATSALNK